jgi:hypothetical protein
MKTRIVLLTLVLAASCGTKNQNSALVITKVIPPTAKGTPGTGGAAGSLACSFDPGQQEYTPYLPINPNENRGIVAAVVGNNLTNPAKDNTVLRTDSTMFLPHQAVVTYEIASGPGTAPGPSIVPASGISVPSGGTGTVGIEMFRGVSLTSFLPGSYVRTTFHLEGKLNDGSSVRTTEREYLFQFCGTPGCGTGGTWAADVGGGLRASCM